MSPLVYRKEGQKLTWSTTGDDSPKPLKQPPQRSEEIRTSQSQQPRAGHPSRRFRLPVPRPILKYVNPLPRDISIRGYQRIEKRHAEPARCKSRDHGRTGDNQRRAQHGKENPGAYSSPTAFHGLCYGEMKDRLGIERGRRQSDRTQ